MDFQWPPEKQCTEVQFLYHMRHSSHSGYYQHMFEFLPRMIKPLCIRPELS